jgi:hypothetical protein
MSIFRLLTLLTLLLLSATVTQAAKQNVLDTFTKEKRGIAGWETEAASCKYAKLDAEMSAKAACDRKLGKVLKTMKEECHSCKKSKHWNEWYCTGSVTLQCQYEADEKEINLLEKLRGLLQDEFGNPYTETNNPCTKDTNTKKCNEYRKAVKAIAGVRA